MRVNVDLQEDFSMNHALSLYLFETIPLLEPESETYALDLLTLVESILENPELILRRQLDKLKDRKVAEMKAEGLDYDQRMAELEKMEHPKPLRDFVYTTFNAFADRHPWVGEENIRPKSIAREMFEGFRSFSDYVQEYDLERAEGLLLRHLNSVYKVLSQTVPDGVKTDADPRDGAVPARHAAAGGLEPARGVGAHARPELRGPGAAGGAAAAAAGGAAGRHAGHQGLHRRHPHPRCSRSCARGRSATTRRRWPCSTSADDGDGEAWTAARLRAAREAHRAEHGGAPPRSRGAQPPPHRRAPRRGRGRPGGSSRCWWTRRG